MTNSCIIHHEHQVLFHVQRLDSLEDDICVDMIIINCSKPDWYFVIKSIVEYDYIGLLENQIETRIYQINVRFVSI